MPFVRGDCWTDGERRDVRRGGGLLCCLPFFFLTFTNSEWEDETMKKGTRGKEWEKECVTERKKERSGIQIHTNI